MTVHQELVRAAPPGDTFLTVGVFDGVHVGHQHLLRCLVNEARRHGALAGVVTFRNHPRTVLMPEGGPPYITSLAQREALLHAEGVDTVVTIPFTKELSLLDAREFVRLLLAHLRMKGLVVGPDFALGHNREGTVSALRALGRELGFQVVVVGVLLQDGAPIRSTAIRQALSAGEVVGASRMLGRPFSLDGVVVAGNGRGKTLGFPTANLQVDPGRILPADGIYAAWAVADGVRYPSATSIGVRPTFGAGARSVEAYLMDYQGDLYGKRLELQLVSRLRDELAFPSAEALVEQMHRDVASARAALS